MKMLRFASVLSFFPPVAIIKAKIVHTGFTCKEHIHIHVRHLQCLLKLSNVVCLFHVRWRNG